MQHPPGVGPLHWLLFYFFRPVLAFDILLHATPAEGGPAAFASHFFFFFGRTALAFILLQRPHEISVFHNDLPKVYILVPRLPPLVSPLHWMLIFLELQLLSFFYFYFHIQPRPSAFTFIILQFGHSRPYVLSSTSNFSIVDSDARTPSRAKYWPVHAS